MDASRTAPPPPPAHGAARHAHPPHATRAPRTLPPVPPQAPGAPAIAGAADTLVAEIMAGLRAPQRHLPCKLLYDERGAELFERITTLDAYYPTRTELGIFQRALPEIAAAIGPHARVVEFGSGSGRKTRLLLHALDRPAAYAPVDISRAQLDATAASLAGEFPALHVTPVAADYTADFQLPLLPVSAGPTLAFFPGSTIGNFEPEEALRFLRHIASLVGDDGALLIGVDLVKDIATLERAYNDPQGVTAAFNLNVLSHVNHICGTDFRLPHFHHRAIYDPRASRIEMRLVCRHAHVVRVPGSPAPLFFRPAEYIVTEHSYKYQPAAFSDLARSAGFSVQASWTDPRRWFGVYLLARQWR